MPETSWKGNANRTGQFLELPIFTFKCSHNEYNLVSYSTIMDSGINCFLLQGICYYSISFIPKQPLSLNIKITSTQNTTHHITKTFKKHYLNVDITLKKAYSHHRIQIFNLTFAWTSFWYNPFFELSISFYVSKYLVLRYFSTNKTLSHY